MTAIEAGDVALVAQLLAKGADPNGEGRKGEASPLWRACTWHLKIPHLELARLLLGAGADVNGGPLGGGEETPLHRAAMTGNLALVQLLVENGAALNERDSDGMAPLKLAHERLGNPGTEQEARHQVVVDYLVSKGCKPYGLP